MSALIRKEVRLLLPNFLIGLALISLLWLLVEVRPNQYAIFGMMAGLLMFGLCPALLAMLSVSSLGREISAGTFGHLLVQPLSRERIWWTKVLLLAAAVALLWAAWWLALHHNLQFIGASAQTRREILVTSFFYVLAAYSGGLWMVLLFRHVAAAFWLTLLTPFALIATISQLLVYRSENIPTVLCIVFVIYSVAGILFARWLFLRAQDAAWTGGTVELPRWRPAPIALGRPARPRHPWWVLIAKEFRLQQSQFIVAGVMILIHGAILLTRHFVGNFREHALLELLVEGFWVLWLLLPLLIGCDSVAQERNLGTLEAQLCLPTRRTTQFAIKFAIVLLLSLFFGGFAPVAFEGHRILPLGSVAQALARFVVAIPEGTVFEDPFITRLETFIAPLLLGSIPLLLGTIAFYVSTLARSTVQALGPALLGIAAASVLILGNQELVPLHLWRGPLGQIIGIPVVGVTWLVLAFWNFKHVHVGGLWRRNLIGLLCSLASIACATTAIYHRSWEFFLAAEPAHGPARITGQEQATLQSDGLTTIVRLPDGRAWALTLLPNSRGRLLPGTNWVSLDRCYADPIGVQRDGSLWVLPQGDYFARYPTTEGAEWFRIGSETNWKTVVALLDGALLLKTDGTLWFLKYGARGKGYQRADLKTLAPQPLDADADWNQISKLTTYRAALRKSNGQVWVSPAIEGHQEQKFLTPEISIFRVPYFELYKDVSERFGRLGMYYVGVGDDGSFRVAASMGWEMRAGRIIVTRPTMGSSDAPISNETNWVAVAGIRENTVTLRADGTLWKWNFPPQANGMTPLNNATSFRLGNDHDWIAVTSYWEGVLSLAADGSVWLWHFLNSNEQSASLLAAPRHPKYLGNIFAEERK